MGARFGLILFLFLSVGCSTAAEMFPAATYDAGPPLMFVGHWNLEPPSSGDALWIEADGTYVEHAAPYPSPLDISFLTSGAWTFASPTLTFLDASGVDYHFRVEHQPGGLVLIGTKTWVFTADQPDGGP